MSDYNPFALTGRSILVTGASSGIGRATAIECARLGAQLVLTGRNAERLRETLDRLEGAGHREIPADLTADDDLAKLVAACPALNGVVLGAGVNTVMPLALGTKERFAEVFGINFTAPVELLRLLFKAGKIAASGSIVFVSSVAGSPGGTAAGNTAYAASKAALDAAMRHLVREFSARRIRFNSVAPGAVDTPLAARIREKLTPGQIAAELARYPLGRTGAPEDIAHGIAYLLSDAASWVTGQRLVIDGGLTS